MEEQHQNPSKIVKEWLEQMGKLQWDPWPEEQIKPYFENHGEQKRKWKIHHLELFEWICLVSVADWANETKI